MENTTNNGLLGRNEPTQPTGSPKGASNKARNKPNKAKMDNKDNNITQHKSTSFIDELFNM
eukprot:CAMPEP_0118660368 /NCGR_PEP_ID=MMETSP0785-20121206/15640_1 /TAXON_ID=91992 /ORGANISM="Bolidomonas pacifica, Strain CCMP 1866" /LENGTH=60 /DNA_ID=CAMNT_0006553599 /DNA_START=33 /DNA_END=212 /DNA_ORIENTATION=-